MAWSALKPLWARRLRFRVLSPCTTPQARGAGIRVGSQRTSEKKKIAGLLCLLGLVPMVQAQGGYTLDQVFAKMDEIAKTFRSSQADIERTHVTILVNDKDVSSGKFYYVRQGNQPRVRLEL